VDIHCHILPNVDDGATTWEISVEMCRMAQADGIKHIVATPHANGKYVYDRDSLSQMLEELSRRVGPELGFSLGCDFHFTNENLRDVLLHPARYTISGTNYLLVELSNLAVSTSISQSLQQLLDVGISPIITHPERSPILQRNPKIVINWVRNGCFVQVTANSLTGRWGAEAQAFSEWLIKRGAVHVLASDAHGVGSRPPILSKARSAAEKIVGQAAAEAMVKDNPQAVIAGEPIILKT
jgi:protein-tyrosine phosphatase